MVGDRGAGLLAGGLAKEFDEARLAVRVVAMLLEGSLVE